MATQNNGVGPTNPTGYVDSTYLNSGLYGRPLILNKIFELLILMTTVLQNTAAAQAQRLNILSNWQQAYSNELNQIHSFVGGNGDGGMVSQKVGTLGPGYIGVIPGGTGGPGGAANIIDPTATLYSFNTSAGDNADNGVDGGSTQAAQVRSDLNSQNNNYTQQIQGNRDTISNAAKGLQSNVQQTSDEVQSQTDIATSILQTLSTILSSIFSGTT